MLWMIDMNEGAPWSSTTSLGLPQPRSRIACAAAIRDGQGQPLSSSSTALRSFSSAVADSSFAASRMSLIICLSACGFGGRPLGFPETPFGIGFNSEVFRFLLEVSLFAIAVLTAFHTVPIKPQPQGSTLLFQGLAIKCGEGGAERSFPPIPAPRRSAGVPASFARLPFPASGCDQAAHPLAPGAPDGKGALSHFRRSTSRIRARCSGKFSNCR
jgi:hypothetical protein